MDKVHKSELLVWLTHVLKVEATRSFQNISTFLHGATSKMAIIFKYVNNREFCEELVAYVPLYDTDGIENEASNNSIVAHVFVCCDNANTWWLHSNARVIFIELLARN